MAVISQISVGDIMYYQVDDIPTHVAPKGSVSIMDGSSIYDNGFTYINNDGGTTWLKCVSPSYGKISLTNATNTIDFDSQAIGSWYAFNGTPAGASWLRDSDSHPDWILATENTTTDDLKYTGSTPMRVVVFQECTIRSGSAKWTHHLTGPSTSFTVPLTWMGSFAQDNAATTNQASKYIRSIETNDYFLGGISPVSRESGGGSISRDYIPRHCSITAIKLDEPLYYTTTLIDDTFESGNFTASGWTVVNDTTNVWVVGTAQNNTPGGTYAAYVSSNGGTSATYIINVTNVSHFYKDFTFPADSVVTLTFDWKCQGENGTTAPATQYDYGAVVITTTGTTPAAGTEVTTTQTGGAATTRLGAEANLGKFNLNYGTTPGTTWNTESISLTAYAGETKRIVFTWRNDGSVGTDPPFIVDNIKITADVIQY